MGSNPDFQGLGDVVEFRDPREVVVVVVQVKKPFRVWRPKWLTDLGSCRPTQAAPGVPELASGSPP